MHIPGQGGAVSSQAQARKRSGRAEEEKEEQVRCWSQQTLPGQQQEGAISLPCHFLIVSLAICILIAASFHFNCSFHMGQDKAMPRHCLRHEAQLVFRKEGQDRISEKAHFTRRLQLAPGLPMSGWLSANFGWVSNWLCDMSNQVCMHA